MWSTFLTILHTGPIALLMKGGVIMIPLLVASLISVAVILERFHFWWRLGARGVGDTILGLIAEGQFEAAWQVEQLAEELEEHATRLELLLSGQKA
jgi:biopolymer transport protein ExbB/TolQ